MSETMYTISRRRMVEQVFVYDYYAESEEAALALANLDQQIRQDNQYSDVNEWHDIDDEIKYSIVTHNDVLEVVENETR